jgi:tRNA-dihydrouridine synthase 2
MTSQPPSSSSTALTIQERANELFQNSEILAPMVRASSTPLRLLALSYGADLVYTEEIIDRAITATERVVNHELHTIDYVKKLSTFSAKQQRKMKQRNESTPVVLRIDPQKEYGKLIYQIGTGESNLALPAATMVANDVNGIDINMGCPKKFSVSGGMGSALLSDLPRACDIIKTLRRNLNIPISCKIRLLEDDSKTLDFIQGLVNAGANAVTIHGRMAGDESIDPARMDRLINVVQLVKSSSKIDVPIIINGDLYTRNDMANIKRQSGADGVMLARPALYNTSIFRKPEETERIEEEETLAIAAAATANTKETRYGYDSPLLLSKTQVIQEYLSQAQIYKPHYKNVKYVICEMMNNRRTPSGLTPFMSQVYPGKQTIDSICKCKSLDDLCKVWDVKFSSLPSCVTPTTTCGVKQQHFTTVNDNNKDEILLHRYDDQYFLDPEALHRKRKQEEEKVDCSNDNGTKGLDKIEKEYSSIDKQKCNETNKDSCSKAKIEDDVKGYKRSKVT